MKIMLLIKVGMVIVLIQWPIVYNGDESAPFSNPDIASLVTPLFAFGGKRGRFFGREWWVNHPLYRLRKRGWSSEA
jgi:hypothetical protein